MFFFIISFYHIDFVILVCGWTLIHIMCGFRRGTICKSGHHHATTMQKFGDMFLPGRREIQMTNCHCVKVFLVLFLQSFHPLGSAGKSKCGERRTQGFLTAITLQIDTTIGWGNLGFISFWPIISINTLLIIIKSWKNILDITFEVLEEIIWGAAVDVFHSVKLDTVIPPNSRFLGLRK